MKILALETSGEAGSVALQYCGEVQSVPLESGPAQSASAIERIDSLLAAAGCRLEDLDGIAFSAGPGAFTGLRLGCGIAQGLAMGAGIGVMPIGTLDALAAQIQEGEVIAAMDARMGELYWARFRCSKGIPFPLGEPECVSPSNWQPVLGSVCSGIGSAFKAHRDALNPGIFTGLVSIFDDRTPRANEIARLAADQRYAAAAIDPALAAPLYVRDKVARTTVERLAQGGKA